MPIGFSLAGAKADECQVLLDLLHDHSTLAPPDQDRSKEICLFCSLKAAKHMTRLSSK